MSSPGTIKFFDQDKGFGFVTPEGGGDDVFLHITVCNKSGYRSPTQGDNVLYDSEMSDRGAKVTHIEAQN